VTSFTFLFLPFLDAWSPVFIFFRFPLRFCFYCVVTYPCLRLPLIIRRFCVFFYFPFPVLPFTTTIPIVLSFFPPFRALCPRSPVFIRCYTPQDATFLSAFTSSAFISSALNFLFLFSPFFVVFCQSSHSPLMHIFF